MTMTPSNNNNNSNDNKSDDQTSTTTTNAYQDVSYSIVHCDIEQLKVNKVKLIVLLINKFCSVENCYQFQLHLV